MLSVCAQCVAQCVCLCVHISIPSSTLAAICRDESDLTGALAVEKAEETPALHRNWVLFFNKM